MDVHDCEVCPCSTPGTTHCPCLHKQQPETTHHEWSVESEVIERNSVRCDSCGDEIESTHRHDFRACKCGRVLVDGGKDYRKRGYQGDGGPTYTDTSIYEVFRVEYVDLDEVARTFLRRVDDSTPSGDTS